MTLAIMLNLALIYSIDKYNESLGSSFCLFGLKRFIFIVISAILIITSITDNSLASLYLIVLAAVGLLLLVNYMTLVLKSLER